MVLVTAGTLATVCKFLWAAFFAVWLLWGVHTKAVQFREGILSRLTYSVWNMAAFLAVFTEFPRRWLSIPVLPHQLWLRLLGLAVTLAGLGFAMWARAYLGGNWSSSVTVKTGHALVRTGPYRWVRHPIYSGMILALLGTALAQGEVRALLGVPLLYVGFSIKAGVEERTLAGVFGAAYGEYARTTGGILPRLR